MMVYTHKTSCLHYTLLQEIHKNNNWGSIQRKLIHAFWVSLSFVILYFWLSLCNIPAVFCYHLCGQSACERFCAVHTKALWNSMGDLIYTFSKNILFLMPKTSMFFFFFFSLPKRTRQEQVLQLTSIHFILPNMSC